MSNKVILKLFAVGIALTLVGLFFLIRPKTLFYCQEVGQAVIAFLAVLIFLQLVNLYLNLKSLKKKKRAIYRSKGIKLDS